MTELKKKKKIIIIILISLLFIAFLLIPVIKTSVSDKQYIVTDIDGKFFHAKKMFICGNTVICMKGIAVEDEKSALPPAEAAEYSLSILSVNKLRNIEILPDVQTAEEEQGKIEVKHLGKYRIQLQGHTGTLRLWVKDEKVYGTVRFPEWGKGATEYLKNIRISGNNISFTRSANSVQEINRLGANAYFTQKFSGKYSNSGRSIDGYFTNDRKEKHQWEADR